MRGAESTTYTGEEGTSGISAYMQTGPSGGLTIGLARPTLQEFEHPKLVVGSVTRQSGHAKSMHVLDFSLRFDIETMIL